VEGVDLALVAVDDVREQPGRLAIHLGDQHRVIQRPHDLAAPRDPR
jgi:hypothetical protein